MLKVFFQYRNSLQIAYTEMLLKYQMLDSYTLIRKHPNRVYRGILHDAALPIPALVNPEQLLLFVFLQCYIFHRHSFFYLLHCRSYFVGSILLTSKKSWFSDPTKGFVVVLNSWI